MLPPLEDDPRFAQALAHFASRDWLEASDLFEELFFEAVRDEVPLVRVLLQVSTGMHHISRGQRRAAAERLEEGLRAIETVTNARGVDLAKIGAQVKAVLAQFARNSQELPD
jgi:predicted metal-dependent hydrolase